MIFGKKKEVELRDKIIKYKKVFGTEDGKYVLCDLMNVNFMLQSTHVKGDDMRSMKNEGRREAVLGILQNANVDINQLDKMMKGEIDHE